MLCLAAEASNGEGLTAITTDSGFAAQSQMGECSRLLKQQRCFCTCTNLDWIVGLPRQAALTIGRPSPKMPIGAEPAPPVNTRRFLDRCNSSAAHAILPQTAQAARSGASQSAKRKPTPSLPRVPLASRDIRKLGQVGSVG